MVLKVLKDKRVVAHVGEIEYDRVHFSFLDNVSDSVKLSVTELLSSSENQQEFKSKLLANGFSFEEKKIVPSLERDLDHEERRNVRFVYESNLIEDVVELSEDQLSQQYVGNVYSGHVGAWKTLRELALKHGVLTSDVMGELHKKISIEQKILGHPIDDKQMGVIRDENTIVSVGGRVCFPPSQDAFDDLFNRLNEILKDLVSKSCTLEEVLDVAAEFHYDYEIMHPYVDGNGRTGRLLINYILLYCGFEPLVITNYDKGRYYECFGGQYDDHVVFKKKMFKFFKSKYSENQGD